MSRYKSLKKTFKRLSEEQQEVITDLVWDIANEGVNPVNLANRNAARIVLARFEGGAVRLSADECAAELARCDFRVALDMTPETPGDGYFVTKIWTLKGLRYELARERFMETITCNVEGQSPTD